ncbi:MAG: RNA methyltransferase [Bacteroidales bacterium]|jgi:tRNA (guanosine-2'-O-)-methyltransferase|nr:RNA methyltransferase [Bacteroidales bacterium]HOL98000.1 RNA methyltransferase [Bacteroidales bacterium]HOM36571.1 RNA methyltransferase [Bacteroidales bacterium]HPD23688.1 RNA methyltransferase [Bacteroidales bacterium]HRS99803.1 RNA methyltransferase [Bacteroidales bacterium]
MTEEKVINILSGMITENRFNKFNEVLDNRTRYITVVLEDLFQSHNASAVLRSCDCFGIQDVHFIENNFQYQENPEVSMGSSQWLNIHRYNQYSNNTERALLELKKQGYRIIATTPHTKENSLQKFDIKKGKVALVFGAELPGLSEIALNIADEHVNIPMFGFTESFNISVSAAIFLYELRNKLNESNIDWHLSKKERDIILAEWLKKSVKDSEIILKNIQS